MSETKEHHHDAIEKGMRNPKIKAQSSKLAAQSSQLKARSSKPILYSSAMVQAILNGTKTETRRVVKSGFDHHSMDFKRIEVSSTPSPKTVAWFNDESKLLLGTKFKYGNVGDLLWVRETTAFTKGGYQPYDTISYKADSFHKDILRLGVDFPEEEICAGCWYDEDFAKELKWTPSIHVKKIYARIWLEVTEIKVERIADISRTDCIAEGIEGYGKSRLHNPKVKPDFKYKNYLTDKFEFRSPLLSFETLWQSINGKPKPIQSKINGKLQTTGYIVYPFDHHWAAKFHGVKTWRGKPLTVIVNPWVWVVKFKVLSTTGKENIQHSINNNQ